MSDFVAIILAAGENRRMGQIGEPKALLPIGEKTTFLDRHVSMLSSLGVTRIYVIAHERYARAFDRMREANAIKVVISPYSNFSVGSTLSALCGLDQAADDGGISRVLIMDADIVYEAELLKTICHRTAARSELYVINRVAGDSEEVRVYASQSGEPILLGKGLPLAVVSELTLVGESLGIISLSAKDVSYVREVGRWLCGAPPEKAAFGFSGSKSEHEELWQYMFSLRRLSAVQMRADLLFAECDTPADLAHIQTVILPKICRRELGIDLQLAASTSVE